MHRHRAVCGLVLAAFAAAGAAQNSPQFPVMELGGVPPAVQLRSADLDADGDLDLLFLVENDVLGPTPASSGLWVSLGDGGGSLGAPTTWPAQQLPQHFDLGDIDGDGSLDAVVANAQSDNLSVLFGNGAGGFVGPYPVPVGDRPEDIALGDVDENGTLDAVVAVQFGHALASFPGDGHGNLLTPTVVALSYDPVQAVLADLDEDGLLDVLLRGGFVAGERRPGAPGLAWGAPVPLPLATGGRLDVLDLSEDGHADLVVSSTSLQTYLGDGHGGLALSASVVVGSNPGAQRAFGDVNRDGHVDVVAGQSSPTLAHVLLGDGAGGLTEVAALAGPGGHLLLLADLDGDGAEDLVTGIAPFQLPDAIGVVRGDPAGLFQVPDIEALDSGSESHVLADFDSDGLPDVLTTRNGASKGLRAYANLGDGRFAGAVAWIEPDAQATELALDAADMNVDGALDALVTAGGTRRVRVLLGAGDGSFTLKDTEQTGTWPVSVSAGALDDDGLPDVLVGNSLDGTLARYFGEGGGRISSAVTDPIAAPLGDALLTDATGDGVADIVALLGTPSRVAILPGDGSGSFPTQLFFSTGGFAGGLCVADLDGDGAADVLAGTSTAPLDPKLFVLHGNGAGGFAVGVPIPLDVAALELDVADVDGDARPDVLLATSAGVSVLDQLAAGAFGPRRPFGTGYAKDVFAADANGDGTPDIVLGTVEGPTALLNSLGALAVLGEGLSGAQGVPALACQCDFTPGSPLALHLRRAKPAAAATLVVGTSLAAAPFKGGVLVPSVDAAASLVTDAEGEVTLLTTWPASVPSGTRVWLQAWIADDAAPHDLAASRGLQVTAP